jgi:lipopolysaccharide biosynthesis regulator YciM
MFALLNQSFSDFNLMNFLMAILAAFVIGIILGRWIRRTRAKKVMSLDGQGDTAFFKGIRYILSNDHDQAIEQFTKSVQLNSDTIETYVALGNLFRSKGDIDRAIRIRQSIILRPNIDEQTKLQALFDMGMDYRKGGLLNRALTTFLKVIEKVPSDINTLEEIERIYEEIKDWGNAYITRKKITRLTHNDHRNILAHHLVEMGKENQNKGELEKAISLYNRAINTHKQCVDAYLHLGDLYFENREHDKAIATWKKIVDASPNFMFLAYRRLEGAYSKMKNLKPIGDFLKAYAKSTSDAFTQMALARYLYNKNDIDGALEYIAKALKFAPNFWKARKLKGEIILSHGKRGEVVQYFKELLKHLDVPYLRFQCSQCGFQTNELQWQCPQCTKWDTIHLIDSAGGLSTEYQRSAQ